MELQTKLQMKLKNLITPSQTKIFDCMSFDAAKNTLEI